MYKEKNVLISDIVMGVFTRNNYACTVLYLEKGRLISKFDIYPDCTVSVRAYNAAVKYGLQYGAMEEVFSKQEVIYPEEWAGNPLLSEAQNEYVKYRRVIDEELFRHIQENLSIKDIVTIEQFYGKLDIDVAWFFLCQIEPERKIMEKKYGDAYYKNKHFYGFTDSFVYDTITVAFPKILKEMREKEEGVYMYPFWKQVENFEMHLNT